MTGCHGELTVHMGSPTKHQQAIQSEKDGADDKDQEVGESLQGCDRHVSWVLRLVEDFFRQRIRAEKRKETS